MRRPQQGEGARLRAAVAAGTETAMQHVHGGRGGGAGAAPAAGGLPMCRALRELEVLIILYARRAALLNRILRQQSTGHDCAIR